MPYRRRYTLFTAKSLYSHLEIKRGLPKYTPYQNAQFTKKWEGGCGNRFALMMPFFEKEQHASIVKIKRVISMTFHIFFAKSPFSH